MMWVRAIENPKAARRAAPNQSPAQRVWFGEEGQRSGAEFSPQGETQRSGFRPDEGGLGNAQQI